MTLRDYFASAALKGLCAAIDNYGPGWMVHPDETAGDAYAMADAMLAERNK